MPRLPFASALLGVLFGASCGSEPPARQPEPLPAATVAPVPAPAPPAGTGAAAVPSAPGTLSLPSGLDFSCQSEAQCLAHRCNLAVGKCVWPCQTDNDCQPGFTCLPPACLPRLGN